MRLLVKYQSNLTVRLRDIINIIKLNNIFLKNIYYLAGTEPNVQARIWVEFWNGPRFLKKNYFDLFYFLYTINLNETNEIDNLN